MLRLILKNDGHQIRRMEKIKARIVVVGDIVEQRFVETGIVGDRDYEILSGLQEGEEIVTGALLQSAEIYMMVQK